MDLCLSREQLRRIDRQAVERYGIPSLLLMENAGRGAAEMIRAVYGEFGAAFVVCGTGNNGGDGCVIARHLHNAGWSMRVLLAGEPQRMTADMRTNFNIASAMGLSICVASDAVSQQQAVAGIAEDDVVVDALLGTGFTGEVRSPLAELISALNAARRPMVAVDVPSGMDCDTGLAGGVCIVAGLTVTFVAKKPGLVAEHAAAYVGRLEVAGIGAPRELIAEVAAS